MNTSEHLALVVFDELLMAKRDTDISTPENQKSSDYDTLLSNVVAYLNMARKGAVRAVNAAMTAAYWAVGGQIVEFERSGTRRAAYGDERLKSLAASEDQDQSALDSR